MRLARRVLTTLFLSLAACGQGTDESAADRVASANADPAYGRGIGEYQTQLAVDSNTMSDLLTYMSGWFCTTTASLRYSEVQANHEGKSKTVYHEDAVTFAWGGNSTVNMPFTRDFSHSNPMVHTTVSHDCHRSVPKPCQQTTCVQRDKNGNCTLESTEWTTCMETESFIIYWDCEDGELPDRQGGSHTQRCTSRSTFWNFLAGFAWGAWLRDLTIQTTTTLKQTRRVFDFNNCSSTNGRPFYLRITQGLGGHVGENDFLLTVNLDGTDIMTSPSESGLYTLAIAYCPPTTQDTVGVTLRAIEDDVWFDDVYSPEEASTNVQMERGTKRTLTLVRKGILGESRSTVLVESFAAQD